MTSPRSSAGRTEPPSPPVLDPARPSGTPVGPNFGQLRLWFGAVVAGGAGRLVVDTDQLLVARSHDVVVGDGGAGCVALQRDGLVAGAGEGVLTMNREPVSCSESQLTVVDLLLRHPREHGMIQPWRCG